MVKDSAPEPTVPQADREKVNADKTYRTIQEALLRDLLDGKINPDEFEKGLKDIEELDKKIQGR
ncbi:hypothetical protein KBC75_00020 [Candidatus Shapirobacteria bacterium]|nr:hypothetical protein [Candidatus Shapirobacteria bacterium]